MIVATPKDGMVIRENTRLVPGVYHLPRGIAIEGDGVTLDADGAVLIGGGRQGAGLTLRGSSGVTIRNICLREYYHGIRATECTGLTLAGNRITSTAEVPPNTTFLEIWLTAENAYGGAILLDRVTDSVIEENDLQHQQNGLLTYDCRGLSVRRNQANYNSGYGIHLYGTCDSLFEENSADYCCRFEPREGGAGGHHFGHMGADATGFLAVNGSSRNTFRHNTARLGGDGFFLAGLAPDGTKCGCDDNLFEENDGSLSPNIAFEATFSRGNIFRNNYADRCNYGFWLGFSWDTTIENNRMVMNRQAGIGVENAHAMRVRGNTFQANGHGVLLWSTFVEKFVEAYPENRTSYDWTIEDNVFTRNGKGIRIAADQDHGIRNRPEEVSGRPDLRPHDHMIRKNDIQDNRIGIELYRADRTIVEGNILNRNVEANVRQDDCEGTVMRNNLGAAGGYL
jgi:parallel beta-helix repeat protein